MRTFALSLILGSVTALAACMPIDTRIKPEDINRPLIPQVEKYEGLNPEASKTYIRPTDPAQEIGGRRVSINAPSISLAELLYSAVPEFRVHPMDSGVDLTMAVRMSVRDIPVRTFIEQLANVTGLDITTEYGTIPTLRLASIAQRSWNLSALTSNREAEMKVGGDDDEGGGRDSVQASGGAGGGGTGGSATRTKRASTITVKSNEDEWESIINDIKALTGADAEPPRTRVMAVRTIGRVEAIGPPPDIRRADDYVRSLIQQAQRQVHLSLRVHEVTLNDSRAFGINWEGFKNFGIGESTLVELGAGFTSPLTISPANPATGGIGFTASSRGDSVGALVEFLGQYGTVTLRNQPNVLVINGRTATINSGEESSYVDSIVTTTGENGLFQIAPSFQRILVGIEFAVTAKVLDNDQILLDVVPVVSALNSFQDFEFGGNEFQTPRVALSELSTSVIVPSGRTVHIGGLITDRISETLNRVPGNEATLLGRLFRSDNNELARRELVITITPRLVGTSTT